ncbi:maleylpyruvate isomerase family mycothiol-dependent enzyme [Angustibacter peucedani]
MTAFADDPLLAQVCEQTDRLLSTARALDDDAVRAPSGLPGWTRGHVLTHVARNADGLSNVASSAVTGEITPMYASQEARDAAIEAGAGRSASDLEADVESSAERLLSLLAAVPEDGLDVEVPSGRGPTMRVRDVLWLRLREVVYHHVDLGAGFTFADAPAELLRTALAECPPRMTRATPGATVSATYPDGAVEQLVVGDGAVAVSGPASAVLAWLTGRSDGDGLEHAEPLPTLPSWG